MNFCVNGLMFQQQFAQIIFFSFNCLFHMTIGFGTTLIGLINAAIGGAMLVIPILALDAGYIEWIIGCLALACITTYTAYLLVKHLGKAKNIKYLVLYHFKGDHTYTTLYNIVIWFSFMSAMIIYYKLFCIQIQGLFGAKQYVPQVLAIVLILWVIGLRECDLSQIALASGISSIVGFMIFLVWVVTTAPEGEKSLMPTNPKTPILLLTLLNAYTIHDFMIQVITINPTRKDYPRIVLWLYFVANIAFMFVCFSASGLVNRVPGVAHPDTIIDFFEGSPDDGWKITCLQLLYIVHILTTFPEFLIVSKVRIFQIFEIEHDPQNDIKKQEVFYIIGAIGICYLLKTLNVSFELILDISGALLGYLFSMFIPIFIHLKCLHYDRSAGYVCGDDERNLYILSNECECNLVYRSKTTMWIETFILLAADIAGGIYFLGTLAGQITDKLSG